VITIRSEETWSLRFSRLGPAGIGLLVMLLGWSDSQLTDGQIPAGAPPLRGVSRRLIDRMIALGEIEETPAGYLIVHYDRYCLMRARILQRAEYERAKKKRQRSARDPESADLPDSPMVMGAVPTGHPTGHPQGHSLPLPSPSPSLCRRSCDVVSAYARTRGRAGPRHRDDDDQRREAREGSTGVEGR
jgi:hypothetical protein